MWRLNQQMIWIFGCRETKSELGWFLKTLPPSGGKCQRQEQLMHLFSWTRLRSAQRRRHRCWQSRECSRHLISALPNLCQTRSLDLKTCNKDKIRSQNPTKAEHRSRSKSKCTESFTTSKRLVGLDRSFFPFWFSNLVIW